MGKARKSRELGRLAPGQGICTGDFIGTLHDKHSLFMQTEAGTATGEDGHKYELGTGGWGGNGPPVVRSVQTGYWFTLSWSDVVRLAREAGIDNPDTKFRARPAKGEES